ncbi:hypothetical protein ACFL0U_04095 [Pseudomonadota bacterium]
MGFWSDIGRSMRRHKIVIGILFLVLLLALPLIGQGLGLLLPLIATKFPIASAITWALLGLGVVGGGYAVYKSYADKKERMSKFEKGESDEHESGISSEEMQELRGAREENRRLLMELRSMQVSMQGIGSRHTTDVERLISRAARSMSAASREYTAASGSLVAAESRSRTASLGVSTAASRLASVVVHPSYVASSAPARTLAASLQGVSLAAVANSSVANRDVGSLSVVAAAAHSRFVAVSQSHGVLGALGTCVSRGGGFQGLVTGALSRQASVRAERDFQQRSIQYAGRAAISQFFHKRPRRERRR